MKTITFVIPVYNEESRLGKTLKALKTLSIPRGLKLTHVIFVNDGSEDNTLTMLRHSLPLLKRKLRVPITILSYPQNRGKGYAVKLGMKAATTDYTLFFDADISTPLSELKKFMPFIQKETDVIVGTRKNGKSTVVEHQPLYREFLGRVFTKLAQKLMKSTVTDFTCGFKAFSKKARIAIFSKARINTWGYDAEIIFLAQKQNLIMAEKAVTWSNDPGTKVRMYKAIPQALTDLFMVRWYHDVTPQLTRQLESLRFLLYVKQAKQFIVSLFL